MVLSVVGGGAVTTGVLAAEEMDDNDSRSSATEMAANTTETGTLEGNDTDWYAFEVEAGERIYSNLTITTENEENLHFDIVAPNGKKAMESPAEALRPGYTTQRIAIGPSAYGGDIAEQSGTYYVQVSPAGDTVGESTSYELTVETQRLDQYDPNEQPASATPIESGETISAVMSGSDQDTYAIDLEEDQSINVTTENGHSALVNTQLLGPNASDGTSHSSLNEHVVAGNYSDPFTYTANTSGTYFIYIAPIDELINTYDEEAPYELSVTVTGADDDESPDEDDSETDDGTTETPDEEDSTDEDDSTETPDETEQSDSEETVDDAGDDAGADDASEDADADTPTETDDSNCEESTVSEDECEEHDDSIEQPECEETE